MKVTKEEKGGVYQCYECDKLFDWAFVVDLTNKYFVLCEQCTDKLAKELTFVLKY